jgi:Sigma-54 interaction domain/Bacterial regulatory protein, Fis family/PAS fold
MADLEPRPAADDLPVNHRLGWTAFLQRSADALFVLNRRRQIRFVNKAWEKLTGWSAARAHGLVCARRAKKRRTSLGTALDPPAEVWDGTVARVRRPVPPARVGPPWWDITFFPLRDASGLLGVFGRIDPVGGAAPPMTAGPPAPVFLRQRAAARFTFDLWPDDPPWPRLIAQARLAAQTRSPVLIHGPAGSGKLWLARTLHHQGVAAERTFLTLDVRGLPAEALTDLLFGPQALAQPDRVGTLYLRGAERLPRDLQLRLADWLSERDPGTAPRVVAGCRLAPDEALRTGRLIEDFHQATAVTTIGLPALRDRPADLPDWTARVLRRLGDSAAGVNLSLEVAELFAAYPWPGNLRELTEVLADCARRCPGKRLGMADLPTALRQSGPLDRAARPDADLPLNLEQFLERMERKLIELALARSGGRRERAAKLLSIPRAKLWRRLRDFGLESAAADDGPLEG